MKQSVNVKLPVNFQSSLFFEDIDTISVEVHGNASDVAKTLFIYDILYSYELQYYKPWIDRESSIPVLLEEWEKNKLVLTQLFSERKRNEAKPIAIKSIAYLTMSLFWMNEKPVASLHNLKEQFPTLTIKPVNCLERFTYIIESPDHYHSFIQLTQLFDELKKQFYKSLLINKK